MVNTTATGAALSAALFVVTDSSLGGRIVNRETWNTILHNWPSTLFIPTILITIVLLGVITRILDDKDHKREAAKKKGSATPPPDGPHGSATQALSQQQ